MNMKFYRFKVTQSFIDLISRYGVAGISDINIGEECKSVGITYKKLLDWDYNEELGELDIFVED